MVARLILILGDQLSDDIAALRAADPTQDVVVMAEVLGEAAEPRHHPKKIAFLFAAMRKFAARLEGAGWRVAYGRLDDPDNAQTIGGELLRRAAEFGATSVLATEPGDWRLIGMLRDHPLDVTLLPDARFLCSHDRFAAWAEGRRELRMEYFYRDMRRLTGLLMEGDKPLGGKWNFDHDNRKPPPARAAPPGPLRFAPDETVRAVLDLVGARFAGHFGRLDDFWFATDRPQALAALDHFVTHALDRYGDYQDAMIDGEKFLWHSVLSMYLNAGLLHWQEICAAAVAGLDRGAPLNAVEGFIRQIIGWREYMRGIYFLQGPDYAGRNALNHTRALPAFFWGAPTDMRCISEVVAQTETEAWAHHIQRLMVTGNFALIAGIDPAQVSGWYLAVYADAYDWVEKPNVIGMSQFADGGIVASKPYVSSGAYIGRMSTHCKHCRYRVKDRTGPEACPFNLLYWHFLIRHRDRFGPNPRMAQMYRTWDRMEESHRATVLAEAEAVLARLDAGQRI